MQHFLNRGHTTCKLAHLTKVEKHTKISPKLAPRLQSNVSEILSEPAYPDLLFVPEAVDIVDTFCRSETVPRIVEQAIQIRAESVWMHKGVLHEGAAEQARAAGLAVVMAHCMMEEARRLIAEGILPR